MRTPTDRKPGQHSPGADHHAPGSPPRWPRPPAGTHRRRGIPGRRSRRGAPTAGRRPRQFRGWSPSERAGPARRGSVRRCRPSADVGGADSTGDPGDDHGEQGPGHHLLDPGVGAVVEPGHADTVVEEQSGDRRPTAGSRPPPPRPVPVDPGDGGRTGPRPATPGRTAPRRPATRCAGAATAARSGRSSSVRSR